MVRLANPILHHLALTVTDLDASMAWYQEIFDVSLRMEVPHTGGTGMLLTDEQLTLAIVLHRHDGNERERFSEKRTGLDHAGFTVASRSELVSWRDHLAAHGVVPSAEAASPLTQSPIVDEVYGSVLVFRDPDNIQLEFVAPPEEAPS
ncbi:MAG: VOC family protein [Actinomycetota bacterium]|nr:VOC family protein [Actinomycetota bacterium]